MEQIANFLSELPEESFFQIEKKSKTEAIYHVTLGIKIIEENKHLADRKYGDVFSNLYYHALCIKIENGLKESLDKYHESIKEIS